MSFEILFPFGLWVSEPGWLLNHSPFPCTYPRVISTIHTNIQHTLSVKSTGRVEKRAGVGKNGHLHRDRDGRIALGPGDRGI